MSKWTKAFFNRPRGNRVYIIPTLNGIKLFSLNFILLVMGLIYANNFLLLFNFILFGFFTITMFYTHFNLQGLTPKSILIQPHHANSLASGNIIFDDKNIEKRYSVTIAFYQKERLCHSIIDEINPSTNVGLISIPLHERGVEKIKRIKLETTFPLNLFRSFSYCDLDFDIVTYPEKTFITLEGNPVVNQQKGDESYFDIKDYQKGDKINSILWKKSGPQRTFVKIERSLGSNSIALTLPSLSKSNTDDFEKKLGEIAATLEKLYLHNIPFGLVQENHFASDIEISKKHFEKCMRILASYGH